MSRSARRPYIMSFLLALGLCSAADAETVHTWVDAQGVRHFSQYPPVDPDQQADTLELEELPAAPETDDRLQTIRDVGRDLELSRQQREEQRARSTPPETVTPKAEAPVVAPSYVLPYPPAYPPPRPRPHPHDRRGSDEPDDEHPRPKGDFISPGRADP